MDTKKMVGANQKRQQHNRRKQKKIRRICFFMLCIVAVVAIAATVRNLASDNANDSTAASADIQPIATAKPKPNIPDASEENDLVKIAEGAKGSLGKKICYLTFDDGPTEAVTTKILDVLNIYDVKATFFMMGKMIDANRSLARRVYDEGHLLADHSYSHDYKSLYATGDSFMAEINKTYDLIKEITGEEEPFKLIRFPGGGYNAGDHAAEKQQYKTLLKQNGFYYADWNCLNGDAEGSNRSAEQLLERTKSTATLDNIVVLMHDAAAKKTTAEALPSIIEYLKDQGYEFRRMDEIDYYDKSEKAHADSGSLVM